MDFRVASERLLQQQAALTAVPFISVILPVRNEACSIATLLEQLLDQEYPRDRYEIIVADGRSTDCTRDIVVGIARGASVWIKLVDNPGILSSAGRNTGIKNSRGDIIAFIDGHCTIPNKQLLADTAEIMRQTGALCLARPQPLTVTRNSFMQSVIAEVRGTALGHGTDSTVFSMENRGFVNPSSSGAIYRREVFDKVGIYDETFDACEDVEFNFRVHQSGISAYIDPRLTIFYEPRKSLSGLFRQMMRYGKGRFRFQAKHPAARSLGQVVPPALLAFMVFSPIGFLVPQIRGLILALFFLYFGAILGFSALLVIRRGIKCLWYAPAAYLSIHLGLGTGIWWELLSRAIGRKSGNNTQPRLENLH